LPAGFGEVTADVATRPLGLGDRVA
jgi:hypothetical protein